MSLQRVLGRGCGGGVVSLSASPMIQEGVCTGFGVGWVPGSGRGPGLGCGIWVGVPTLGTTTTTPPTEDWGQEGFGRGLRSGTRSRGGVSPQGSGVWVREWRSWASVRGQGGAGAGSLGRV